MTGPGHHLVVHGDAADMAIVRDGEAALVLTSPPYFSQETESHLKEPRRLQDDYDRVAAEVRSFADTLAPAFRDIRRILAPTGALVLQTKDLRYGRHLVRLADMHAASLESVGLRLTAQVHWTAIVHPPRRRPSFARAPRVGAFQPLDSEVFMVFSHPGGPGIRDSRLELSAAELEECLQPLWRLPAASHRVHPFQSPPEVVRRFVRLLSEAGDLVVDPFAGSGQILRVAVELGRRAIGYEIDPRWVEIADCMASRACGGCEHG